MVGVFFHGMEEVKGSNPFRSTNILKFGPWSTPDFALGAGKLGKSSAAGVSDAVPSIYKLSVLIDLVASINGSLPVRVPAAN